MVSDRRPICCALGDEGSIGRLPCPVRALITGGTGGTRGIGLETARAFLRINTPDPLPAEVFARARL